MRTAMWVLAALTVSGAAWADGLTATRAQPLREVSHDVEIRVADGVASYTVRRQFENSGSVADEAGLAIELPSGAAATALRIRARDRWFDGELMERDRAAALYQELTGFGAHLPKDPALLQWRWADQLYLQVFPVMPGQVSTVEYTLTVPTRYARGHYWVSYPRTDVGGAHDDPSRLATPTIAVKPAWGDARTPITVDGRRVAPDTSLVLSVPRREAWMDSIPPDPSASYVASSIVVRGSSHTRKPIQALRLDLDITHTYRGDLVVDLVTPQGQRIAVHGRTGGNDNDLKQYHDLKLPAGTLGEGTWRLVVSDHATLDTGSLNAWKISFGSGSDRVTMAATDTPVFIPDAPESEGDAGVAPISISAPPIDVLAARLGRAVASNAHAFARLELDVAPEISKVPVRAQVAFVLDASYSVGPEKLAAQFDTLRAYAAHVPDAEIEIVVCRRRAARLFGAFIPAAQLEEKLKLAAAAGALAFGNGSALEEGAAVAVNALAPRSGPRRAVLLTDTLLRSSLSPERILGALSPLASDTVVHVVVPELDDSTSLERDDSDALAPLATRHHGIFARLRGFASRPDKDLAPVVLELVRPVRIDELEASGFSLDTDTLHEGDGLRAWLTGAAAPSRVVIQGQLWSDPVRREVSASPAFSRATAAFVFGADLHQDLSSEEMMKLALFGRAVSPVTSYVAYEPGTRPSTIGLPRHGSGSGFGSGYGSGHGRLGGSRRRPPDLTSLFDVKACVAAHHPPRGWRLTLELETTRDEVVDVASTSTGAFADCMIEFAWALRLGPSFDRERESFAVELSDR